MVRLLLLLLLLPEYNERSMDLVEANQSNRHRFNQAKHKEANAPHLRMELPLKQIVTHSNPISVCIRLMGFLVLFCFVIVEYIEYILIRSYACCSECTSHIYLMGCLLGIFNERKRDRKREKDQIMRCLTCHRKCLG